MDEEGGIKCFPNLSAIAFSYLEGKKSLGGGWHGAIKESKHRYNPAHHIVDTVILHSQDIQDQARRVQADQ